MKNYLPRFKSLLIITLLVGCATNLLAQTIPVPTNFFGMNYWYYRTVNGTTTDFFYPKISDLTNAGVKMVRIGGNELNTARTSTNDFSIYDNAITNALNMGATPILQIPINIDPANYSIWINHFNSKGIKFYAIGNEPDPADNSSDWFKGLNNVKQEGNYYTGFKNKFVAIAKAIKNASSTDIVVGPDFRLFYEAPISSYYQQFIQDVGTQTANGVPILDIFVFHFYEYKTEDIVRSRLATIMGYIATANANTNRSTHKLSIALGEVNTKSDAAQTVKPWNFEAGQFISMMAKQILSNNGEYACPWAVYEHSGDKLEGDFSVYNTDNTRRSSMVHWGLLGANRRDYYMVGGLNDDVNFGNKIIQFGMTDANGSTIMIMNTTDNSYTYNARLNGTFSTRTTEDFKLKFYTKNNSDKEWFGTIPAKTTLVYTIYNTGVRQNKFEYNKANNDNHQGPTVTLLNSTAYSADALNEGIVKAFDTNNVIASNELNIYPVPVTNVLNVDGADAFKTIKLFNNSGQLVYRLANAGKNNLKIDVSKLKAGMYYLQLSDGKKTISKKVVKR